MKFLLKVLFDSFSESSTISIFSKFKWSGSSELYLWIKYLNLDTKVLAYSHSFLETIQVRINLINLFVLKGTFTRFSRI